jgi:hypothetical protein
MAAQQRPPAQPGGGADARDALHNTIVTATAELSRVDAELAERQRRERRVWSDEQPALEVLPPMPHVLLALPPCVIGYMGRYIGGGGCKITVF